MTLRSAARRGHETRACSLDRPARASGARVRAVRRCAPQLGGDMKRLLALWIGLLALLAPAHARAGTPYTLHWFMEEYPHSCENARITLPSYFDVNGTSIPTFEVPGAFAEHPDNSESNEAEAPFDSVLLRWGSNRFHFKVSVRGGDNRCVDALEIVHLVSAPLGLNQPLSAVRRDG